MKKVCFLISNIDLCGGSERTCLAIASGLCCHGYDVTILTIYGNKKPYFGYDANIKIRRLNSSLEQNFFQSHPKYTILKLRWWCIIHRPPIIIDTMIMMGNVTIPAIKGLGIKHVAWNNFSYEYFKQVHHEQVGLEKIKENRSHLITLTAQDRELFIKEQNVNPDLVHHIPNPLTIIQSNPIEHHNKIVLSVGRFAYEKGFDLLLRAWKIVEEQVSDWSLEIWGDTGLDTGDVRKTYEELSLKHATLHPATTDIRKKYENASIYVLPSRHEGFGLVLLEASAMSLPLIAFDCPNGPREIIEDGVNGRLVDNGDVEKLAQAMVEVIWDDEMRLKMGRKAFEISKCYQVNNIIPLWEDMLRGL